MKQKKITIIFSIAVIFLGVKVSSVSAGDVVNWQSIGPGGGGAMTQVVIDPTNDDIVYVATDLAGIFKSTDGGQSFRFIDNGLKNLVVMKIVIDPKNPQILYLGTKGGLYKSTDGGENWSLKENGFLKTDGGLLSHPVKAIAIDPNDSNILYAGYGVALGNSSVYHLPTYEKYSLGHIFKSTDAGENWQLVNIGNQKIETPTYIMEMAVSPVDSKIIFATTEKGFYKSIDGGINWHKKNQGIPLDDVRGLAINSDNPNVIYIAAVGAPGASPWQGGIFKSIDAGETWTAKINGLEQVLSIGNPNENFTSNYPEIIISPSDPNVLYTGDSIYGAAGIFKSIDGGENWVHKIEYKHPNYINISPKIFGNFAPFHITVSQTNSNLVYFTTSMTLQKSVNGGDTWTKAHQTELSDTAVRSHGIENTNLLDIAVNPSDPNIFYFYYADVDLFRSNDGGKTFEQIKRNLISGGFFVAKNDARIALDPQNSDVIFMSGYPYANYVYGKASMMKTSDGGNNWEVLGNEDNGFPASGLSSITIDNNSPSDSRTIYVTSNKNLGVFKSTDGGRNWSAINNGLEENPQANKIVIDPFDHSKLYLGTEDSFYKSTDAGASWTKSDSLNVLAGVKNMAVNYENQNILYAAAWQTYSKSRNPNFKAGGIFKSMDGGTTWKNIIQKPRVSALAMDPRNPDILFTGNVDSPYYDDYAQCNLFRTVDGGTIWEEINSNLPNRDGLLSLAIAPGDSRVLFIGLGGNGGFLGKVDYAYNKADLNQDGNINVTDLGVLMSDFGKSAQEALNPRSDINSDGSVNVADLGIMMSGWGK